MSRRRNSIAEQFTVRTIRMLESPAYRALSLSAHRLLSRVEVELGHHGGKDNGKLPVTYDDFVEYGVHRHAISPSIRECEALGFLEVTEQGHAGNAEFRSPNKFRLTYAYAIKLPPTDEWQRIKTDEEAIAITRAARRSATRKNRKPVAETFTAWHYLAARRALRQSATVIARHRFGRGRPCLWAPRVPD